jgi:hypothetical protein
VVESFGTGPLVVAAAIPFLFLHRNYQPAVDLGRLHIDLSDVAVAVVVAAALLAVRRAPFPFRDARPVWLALAALALLVVAATIRGGLEPDYALGAHAVTAAKWIEYMLLAAAVPVLCRRPGSWRLPATTFVAWGAVATAFALLQFFGLAGDRIDHTPAGRRKPSFLGDHDLAVVSAAALAYALYITARGARSPLERRIAVVAGVAGAGGLILGGALDSLLGTILAVAMVVAVVRPNPRRAAAVAVAMALVCAGVLAIRSSAIADGLKFLGVKQGTGGAAQNVQSYRQRALLAYIGGRIFLDHPLVGVGFEGSGEAFAYRPYLADARRRFVQPPQAFPSPAHPWGVQNAYVQSAADFGFLGPIAFLAALLVPPAFALRRGRGDARIVGAATGLIVVGAWNGYGLVAGIPLDALTWLGAGLVAISVPASLAGSTAPGR